MNENIVECQKIKLLCYTNEMNYDALAMFLMMTLQCFMWKEMHPSLLYSGCIDAAHTVGAY